MQFLLGGGGDPDMFPARAYTEQFGRRVAGILAFMIPAPLRQPRESWVILWFVV